MKIYMQNQYLEIRIIDFFFCVIQKQITINTYNFQQTYLLYSTYFLYIIEF